MTAAATVAVDLSTQVALSGHDYGHVTLAAVGLEWPATRLEDALVLNASTNARTTRLKGRERRGKSPVTTTA